MSVNAHETTSPRLLSGIDLLAAGPLPLIGVVLAGLTLGFFAWYAAIVPRHNELLSEAALPLVSIGGLLFVAWAWLAYSRYFSRRTGITFGRSLEYDALTWVPFILLWLTFVLPLGITHGSRLFAVCAAFFCLSKTLIAARFNQTVREVLIDFVLTRAAIIVIAELAAVTIGQRAGVHVQESSHLLLAVWGRWDAVHFLNIATHGYQGTDMAFFPLYPALIRIVGAILGNHLVAGLLISNASFFFALLFLYKLLEHEFERPVARRAVFYASIFPTAIFFSAVYTESLFFMLTIASFYYVRERRWWLAGAIGFLAALTRIEGVLLFIPFLIEWWTVYREHFAEGLRNLAAVLLIPLGLSVYMFYLWVLRADPLYFSHVQVHWHRYLAAPWVSVINSYEKLVHATQGQIMATETLELAFTALMIGVLIAGSRQLRPSYIAYMGLSILIPLCTSSLMSMPRFALVLFPMFAIMARWGERPAINNAIVAFSLPLLGLFTVLFADWYWVA